MALTIPQAPARGAELVQENLMLRLDDSIAAAHAIDGSPAVQILPPYPVYTADLSGVLDGTFLTGSRLTAWQYVIMNGTVLGVAEVAAEMAFASHEPAPVADALLDVIRAAENLEMVAGGDFELRLLRAPELYFVAVWLHRADIDWLLPVRPAPAGLQAGSRLSVDQVLEALRPLAKIRRLPEM
jgi:hypothetical protein